MNRHQAQNPLRTLSACNAIHSSRLALPPLGPMVDIVSTPALITKRPPAKLAKLIVPAKVAPTKIEVFRKVSKNLKHKINENEHSTPPVLLPRQRTPTTYINKLADEKFRERVYAINNQLKKEENEKFRKYKEENVHRSIPDPPLVSDGADDDTSTNSSIVETPRFISDSYIHNTKSTRKPNKANSNKKDELLVFSAIKASSCTSSIALGGNDVLLQTKENENVSNVSNRSMLSSGDFNKSVKSVELSPSKCIKRLSIRKHKNVPSGAV